LTVVLLIRLRCNQTLYRAPAPRRAHQKGRPAVHGTALKLRQPSPPEHEERLPLGRHTVILQAWQGLHFKTVAQLVGMVVCVTFLNAEGRPKYKRPLWLFWTGPTRVALIDIARMYLWRFCIEHFFRFMKQHMGLCACNGVSLEGVVQWMRLGMLAYWQLLLAANGVTPAQVPWRKGPLHRASYALTPRQVQLSMTGLLTELGTPAASPKPSGKAPGRPRDFHPKPRPRYAIIRKSRKQAQRTT
jgi:hypothetical protein